MTSVSSVEDSKLAVRSSTIAENSAVSCVNATSQLSGAPEFIYLFSLHGWEAPKQMAYGLIFTSTKDFENEINK